LTGLDRVEFRVAFTGTDITIDGRTGTIPFVARTQGNIYFVDHDQTGEGVGNGTLTSPWKTIKEARPHLVAGDELYVRDSATPYTEPNVTYGSVLDTTVGSSGSPTLPIAVVAYPGEIPVIDTMNSGTRNGIGFGAGKNYWTVAKLKVVRNGTGSHAGIRAEASGTKTSNIRIVGCVVTGFQPSNFGAVTIDSADNVQFIGNYIYNTGLSGENNSHAFYHGGNYTGLYNVEVAYNHISNHAGGRLIQFYAHRSGDEIYGVHIHHNKLHDGREAPSDGILLGQGDSGGTFWIKDAHVHHNEVYNVGRNGIHLTAPDAQLDVHDNVAYASGSAIFIGGTIQNGFVKVYRNCMDEAVTDLNKVRTEVRDNYTNYPACVGLLN
jgi:hypothetical protein